MIRRTLALIIFLFLALALGFAIHRDAGAVIIFYDGWQIQMTLWAALIAVLIVLFVIYLVYKLFTAPSKLSSYFSGKRSTRKTKNAVVERELACCALAEGDWSAAEKGFTQSAAALPDALMNYVFAAQAAEEQGRVLEAEKYFTQAEKIFPKAQFAIYFWRAQFQLRTKQWDAALKTLDAIDQKESAHPLALKWRVRAYQALCRWHDIESLLPVIEKKKVYSPDEFSNLEMAVYQKSLHQAGNTSADAATRCFEALPRDIRKTPLLIHAYYEALMQQGAEAAVLPIIEQALKKEWSALLVNDYGLIHGSGINEQIATAEAWLKKHPSDADLFLCLSRLYAAANLPGQAKYYLEQQSKLKI